jgi:hypothetical protein
MRPLDLEKSATFHPMREARNTYTESDTTRTGDWFSSRAVQAHLLETVRPSRAGIEVFSPSSAGLPPSVLSNVESSLKLLFIIDDDRQLWTAEDVGTGEKKLLKPCTREEFETWLREGPGRLGGPLIGAAIASVSKQTGCVFAEANEAARIAVPTLSSVRWNHDHAIIAGPFLKR